MKNPAIHLLCLIVLFLASSCSLEKAVVRDFRNENAVEEFEYEVLESELSPQGSRSEFDYFLKVRVTEDQFLEIVDPLESCDMADSEEDLCWVMTPDSLLSRNSKKGDIKISRKELTIDFYHRQR